MTDTSIPRKVNLRRHLPLIGILAVAVIGAFTLRDYLSFETLRDNREALIAFRDSHYALTVSVYVALYAVMVAFSLPGAVFVTLAGGFLFGLWFGTLATVTAATIGATLLFLAARYGFGDMFEKSVNGLTGKLGKVVQKIKDGLDQNQWSMLFIIRLVPLVPFFVANLIPALMQVPLSRYVISTFVGIIPGTFVFTSVGAGLGEVFASGDTPDLGIIFEPHVIGPLLGLAALSLLPACVKAVMGKKGA